jgi:AcrR family transcriptional regulator
LTISSTDPSLGGMIAHAPPERLSRDDRSALMRDRRRETILNAATLLAQRVGFGRLTREIVAAEAGVAVGSINHEFGTMDALRDEVMQVAVEHRHLGVVASGLAQRHPIACDAPEELKQEALTVLAL